MKYIKISFIIFLLFLETGCLLGEEGKGYLIKSCTLTENLDSVVKSEEIRITHKDDDIKLITMKKTYTNVGNQYVFSSLKDSIISEQNSLQGEAGLEITMENDKEFLEIQYVFQYENVSDYVKRLYNIESPYHLQIKKLEEQGYTCK